MALKAFASFDQRGRHGPWRLPKNWRAVEGNPGELLYVIRICGRYWCRIEHGCWTAYGNACGPMSGESIGRGPTMDHALLACREHLHAHVAAKFPTI